MVTAMDNPMANGVDIEIDKLGENFVYSACMRVNAGGAKPFALAGSKHVLMFVDDGILDARRTAVDDQNIHSDVRQTFVCKAFIVHTFAGRERTDPAVAGPAGKA